jgi:HipA-like protein
MRNHIKKIFQLLSLHDITPAANKEEAGQEPHSFILMYRDLAIGELRFEGNVWFFEYTKMFQNQSDIQAIPTFPNKNKVYRSEILWPFFQARIPSLKQPKVQEIIREKGIKEDDIIALLKTFGLRSINNPFVLQ